MSMIGILLREKLKTLNHKKTPDGSGVFSVCERETVRGLVKSNGNGNLLSGFSSGRTFSLYGNLVAS